MKSYQDNAPLELTFEEIAHITDALISTLDSLINSEAPAFMLSTFLYLAEKLNGVLKENGFSHYIDDKFHPYEEYIKCHR